ncbi:CoA transferase subunit A [Crenobacter caeni]|uniref:CoA transferase subunit A n=1 Tax=Crenobacter caeni TaxID=2705474 RepID=A0A6B2KUG9_9NEIS|nr:CoA transferase subunit A [Crenobacter caeni]NDV13791.1 CoA transferase subunit A [Crenobacter caeni]
MNKEMTLSQACAQIESGMTVGIGGWGPRRKPMALVRELVRSDVRDLIVVAYGGPEVGMLCAAGKVKKLVFGFVTMDAIPLEPFYRKAREAGELELMELDEGMLEWGLRAAGMRLPYLPTRCGLATDVVAKNADLKTIASPYDDGEVLLAMPALRLDVALLHVNDADRWGNTLITGRDAYFDHLFARAADRTFVSCERLADKFALTAEQAKANLFERYLVSGVVHAPGGAHPTLNNPDYGWDLAHMKAYAAAAGEEGGWAAYRACHIDGGEAAYRAQNGLPARLAELSHPIF